MKKYLRTAIASFIFLVFVVTTILTYTSNDYVRARDLLKYLNSDSAKFSMQVEEHTNNLTGQNNTTEYRKWHNEVERVEAIVKSKQTTCIILGAFSLLSLGCVVVMFVQDRKKAAIVNSQCLNTPIT